MTLAIECRGLTLSYGSRLAVQGLDLQIRRGSVVGLLGPAGAGKSTLLAILATTLVPDAGRFAVAGVPGDRPAELRRHVGVLLEGSGYPEHLSGLDVLAYHARLYGDAGPAARELASRLLVEVGLADIGGIPVAEYSPSMRQRLGVARALVGRPDVLLLDDPMRGLAPADRRRFRTMLASAARERGLTVLLAAEALTDLGLCDRVVVLDDGRIVADGSVQQIAWRASTPRRGRLCVPPAQMDAAFRTLAFLPEVESTERTDAPDELRFGLREGVAPGDGAAAILGAVHSAGVAILTFGYERHLVADAVLAGPPDLLGTPDHAAPGARAPRQVDHRRLA